MASDLKIEIFAFNLFHKCRYDEALVDEPDIFRIYGDEIAGDDCYLEVCDEVFEEAVRERSYMFSNFYYIPNSVSEDVKNFKSLSEVCDYVIDKCERDDLFSELSVFERILASADYVLSMCYVIQIEVTCLKDILKYSHIFWAMYFDKFTEEFYKNGGWNKFRIVANSYHLLEDMFGILGLKILSSTLKTLKESIINYSSFKIVIQCQDNMKIQRGVSLQWVKFSIAFFHGSARLPLNYENYADAKEVHLVLEGVRYCCDPSLFHKIHGKETKQENSKESSLIKNANSFENRLEIDNVFNHEISEVEGFNGGNNVNNAYFNEKLPAERELPEHIDLKSKIIDDDHTSIRNESKNKEFYSRNLEEQSKIPVITGVFSKNQNGKNEYCTETVSKSFCDLKDFGSQSECLNNSNETLTAQNALEGNSFLKGQNTNSEVTESANQMDPSTHDEQRTKKLEEQSKIPVIIGVFSKNQNGKNECCTETVSKSFCDLKHFGSQSECLNNSSETLTTKNELEGNYFLKGQIKNSEVTESANQMPPSTRDETSADTGNELEIIQKAREYLKNEQNDPEIKKFLRLILLLGDNQGLKTLIKTSHGVNQQKKSNKKKKSKNKKLALIQQNNAKQNQE